MAEILEQFQFDPLSTFESKWNWGILFFLLCLLAGKEPSIRIVWKTAAIRQNHSITKSKKLSFCEVLEHYKEKGQVGKYWLPLCEDRLYNTSCHLRDFTAVELTEPCFQLGFYARTKKGRKILIICSFMCVIVVALI